MQNRKKNSEKGHSRDSPSQISPHGPMPLLQRSNSESAFPEFFFRKRSLFVTGLNPPAESHSIAEVETRMVLYEQQVEEVRGHFCHKTLKLLKRHDRLLWL